MAAEVAAGRTEHAARTGKAERLPVPRAARFRFPAAGGAGRGGGWRSALPCPPRAAGGEGRRGASRQRRAAAPAAAPQDGRGSPPASRLARCRPGPLSGSPRALAGGVLPRGGGALAAAGRLKGSPDPDSTSRVWRAAAGRAGCRRAGSPQRSSLRGRWE